MVPMSVLGVHRGDACDPVDSTHTLSQVATEAKQIQAEHHESIYTRCEDDIQGHTADGDYACAW